ncbi:MAG: hypothetical protein ACK4FA_00575 [Candidatus Paceibacteria bacterium]
MQKLIGIFCAAFVVWITVINRDVLTETYTPDYYLFPDRNPKYGIMYKKVESYDVESGRRSLPNQKDTFLVIAMKDGYYNIEYSSFSGLLSPVTYVSRMNFCRLGGESYLVFADHRKLHVLSADNDTLVFQNNTINWLPDKINPVGDSIYLMNDTAQIKVPRYKI